MDLSKANLIEFNCINDCISQESVKQAHRKKFPYFQTKTYAVGAKKKHISFEHPNHMFKQMEKKLIAILQ